MFETGGCAMRRVLPVAHGWSKAKLTDEPSGANQPAIRTASQKSAFVARGIGTRLL